MWTRQSPAEVNPGKPLGSGVTGLVQVAPEVYPGWRQVATLPAQEELFGIHAVLAFVVPCHRRFAGGLVGTLRAIPGLRYL